MSYILGGTTLPQPKKAVRNFIETAVENLRNNGTTTKNTINRKEQFVLSYQNLTRSVANSILSLYEQDAAIDFESTESNFTVATTAVLVDISSRIYPPTGTEYRQDMDLILTEVK